MNQIDEYLANISEENQRAKLSKLLKWVTKTFPNLELQIKWKQPVFTDHDTYIIGFSVAKKHLTVGLETRSLQHFVPLLEQEGIKHGTNTFQIALTDEIPHDLLTKIINYIIEDKKEITTFWDKRKD
ncbi:iron chaperone [Lactobacillus sp. PV034]|uniref:iron chaperone n=1 Tax=Lactobacillus sp. PV034 TaxID=2594495 RepID=UPI00223ED5E1|nr:DUF1801 domain-containing protein [Lactobacillus sp. PV034]QNQ81140.1 iron chaperone [Lactobacillus sp. PV034]